MVNDKIDKIHTNDLNKAQLYLLKILEKYPLMETKTRIDSPS